MPWAAFHGGPFLLINVSKAGSLACWLHGPGVNAQATTTEKD